MFPNPPQPSDLVPRAGCGRGFTLVELMVTLAVLVIVLATATPTMADFTANNQLSATKSSFTAALALARSEAARRGQPVLLVAGAGGAPGNEFAQGWQVVGDDNADGAAADTEPRIRQQGPIDGRVRLSGPLQLAFRGTGAVAGGGQQVFTLCRSDGAPRGLRITVAPSGMADVASIGHCS